MPSLAEGLEAQPDQNSLAYWLWKPVQRYLDRGNQIASEGWAQVIFDDKLIDILKRYGIPITAGAGGAAIVSGANMPPDVAAQLGPEA